MSHLNFHRFRFFIKAFTLLIEQKQDEAQFLKQGAILLQQLTQHDDWLPDEYTRSDPERYQQYLLYVDSLERFSIVSFVWGPGQSTPIHDHTVWGLLSVIRGAEISQSFHSNETNNRLIQIKEKQQLEAGEVEIVTPNAIDIHQVSNAFTDRTSVSIHIYGANIGAVQRATYDLDGHKKQFISGYSNTTLPNFWDISKEQSK